MTTPSIRSVGGVGANTNIAPAPAGVALGDTIVLFVHSDSTGMTPACTGFSTAISPVAVGTAMSMGALIKIADAGDVSLSGSSGSYTVTGLTAAQYWEVTAWAIINADTTTPIHLSGTSATSTSPSLSPTVPNTLGVVLVDWFNGSANATAPTGWTRNLNGNANTYNTYGGSKVFTATGATGTTSWVGTGAGAGGVGTMFILFQGAQATTAPAPQQRPARRPIIGLRRRQQPTTTRTAVPPPPQTVRRRTFYGLIRRGTQARTPLTQVAVTVTVPPTQVVRPRTPIAALRRRQQPTAPPTPVVVTVTPQAPQLVRPRTPLGLLRRRQQPVTPPFQVAGTFPPPAPQTQHHRVLPALSARKRQQPTVPPAPIVVVVSVPGPQVVRPRTPIAALRRRQQPVTPLTQTVAVALPPTQVVRPRTPIAALRRRQQPAVPLTQTVVVVVLPPTQVIRPRTPLGLVRRRQQPTVPVPTIVTVTVTPLPQTIRPRTPIAALRRRQQPVTPRFQVAGTFPPPNPKTTRARLVYGLIRRGSQAHVPLTQVYVPPVVVVTTNSSIPNVIDYLVATFRGLPICNVPSGPVPVFDGLPGPNVPDTFVAIGGGSIPTANGPESWVSVGATTRDENYLVQVAITSYVGGEADAQKAARDRVFAIFNAFDATIRGSHNAATLGGVINIAAEMTDVTLVQTDVNDPQALKGRRATVVFYVHVLNRI